MVTVLFAVCSDMTRIWKRKQVSLTWRCSLKQLLLNRLIKITFLVLAGGVPSKRSRSFCSPREGLGKWD